MVTECIEGWGVSQIEEIITFLNPQVFLTSLDLNVGTKEFICTFF